MPCRGSPATSVAAFLANFAGESVGDRLVDDDALGRHADLTLIEEGAESGGFHRLVEVGVVEHDERRLAAELEQHRLQVARGDLGDDPADPRRAGEVDAPHRRIGDQRLDDLRRVGGRVADDVDDAVAEIGVAQRLADDPMGRGQISEVFSTTVLPQASGVAMARTPRMTGAFHGAMPSHDAGRLAHRHRGEAGAVGRDDLAADLRGHRRRLLQHAGGEHDVELRPAGGRADLTGHGVDEVAGALLQIGGGAKQPRAPLAGPERRPGGKGGGGGGYGARRVGRRGRRRAGRDLAGHRIEPLEASAFRRRNVLALDHQRDFSHDLSPWRPEAMSRAACALPAGEATVRASCARTRPRDAV